MKISVIEPITPAWNHMVRILFKPFDFKKWLALGFCVFLPRVENKGEAQAILGRIKPVQHNLRKPKLGLKRT